MKNDPSPLGENPPSSPTNGIDGVKPSVAGAGTSQTTPANRLTPEEQMALFEKELKENDWGHQPC